MIKPVSDKRRARIPERQALVERVMLKYPSCVMDPIYGTYTPNREPDEIVPRGEWTEGYWVFDNVWALGAERHHIKHHVHPAAAMIVGLYGPKRMRRWNLTIEDRIEYLEKFDDAPIDEAAAKVFLWNNWNRIIPGYWETTDR